MTTRQRSAAASPCTLLQNVLRQDPESLLKQGSHPTPDKEVEFWEHKAANLNAVFDQLQSDRVRRILRFLDANRSTYCTPFAKLCKEVFAARLEANDNARFLRTLLPWFTKCVARVAAALRAAAAHAPACAG